MKRPYFASWNHSRRFALAASPSTRCSTASRSSSSLRVGLATLGPLCSSKTSAAAISRRSGEVRITFDLAASVGDKERHVAALGHDDANRCLCQLVSVDLVELAPQGVGAAADARVFVGRKRIRPPERLHTDQILMQRVSQATQLHLANVAKEFAHL